MNQHERVIMMGEWLENEILSHIPILDQLNDENFKLKFSNAFPDFSIGTCWISAYELAGRSQWIIDTTLGTKRLGVIILQSNKYFYTVLYRDLKGESK